jgi:hypothetical protein
MDARQSNPQSFRYPVSIAKAEKRFYRQINLVHQRSIKTHEVSFIADKISVPLLLTISFFFFSGPKIWKQKSSIFY